MGAVLNSLRSLRVEPPAHAGKNNLRLKVAVLRTKAQGTTLPAGYEVIASRRQNRLRPDSRQRDCIAWSSLEQREPYQMATN